MSRDCECCSKTKEEWRAGHPTWTLQPLSIWDSQTLARCCWPVIRALGQGCELQPCPTRRCRRWRQGRCGGCRVEWAMPQGGVWGGTYDPGPYAQAAALAAHSCGACMMKTQYKVVACHMHSLMFLLSALCSQLQARNQYPSLLHAQLDGLLSALCSQL